MFDEGAHLMEVGTELPVRIDLESKRAEVFKYRVLGINAEGEWFGDAIGVEFQGTPGRDPGVELPQ